MNSILAYYRPTTSDKDKLKHAKAIVQQLRHMPQGTAGYYRQFNALRSLVSSEQLAEWIRIYQL